MSANQHWSKGDVAETSNKGNAAETPRVAEQYDRRVPAARALQYVGANHDRLKQQDPRPVKSARTER